MIAFLERHQSADVTHTHFATSLIETRFPLATHSCLVLVHHSILILVILPAHWPLLFEIHFDEVASGLVVVLLYVEHVMVLQDLVDLAAAASAALLFTVHERVG